MPGPGLADDWFRLAVFGRWRAGVMTMETMGGLSLREATGWRGAVPDTRELVMPGAATLFVPGRRDLAALLRRFGHPKDHVRAALIEACGA